MSFPDDETGKALKSLQEDGSDLSKPMEIDFFIAVPNSDIAGEIAKVISGEGFRCSIEMDDETGAWTCYAAMMMIPSYENVTKLERYLGSVAESLGGALDGFGSYGNT